MAPACQLPLANDYLELRAELGTALFALSSLAAEHHAPAASAVLRQMQAQLREPFVLAALGDGNAGKSSLLNALFGREFCRAHSSPDSGRIHVFKHGDTTRNVSHAPHLIERYRPLTFLRDFNVVDLPGAAGMAEDCRRAADQLTPAADMILFVVSSVDPWASAAWDLLAALPFGARENLVCVLQQADRREAAEIQIVVRHLLQRLSRQLGRAVPVFAVSAKKALLSKTTGVDKVRLWEESGFEVLESHLGQCVRDAETRRGRLLGACRTGLAILDELSIKARAEWSEIDAAHTQLANLRETARDLENRAQEFVTGLSGGLELACVCCQQQGEAALSGVLQRNGWLPLVRGEGARLAGAIRSRAGASLRAVASQLTGQSLGRLQAELTAAWSQLRGRLQTDFEPEARGQLGPGAPDFARRRAALAEEISLRVAEHAADSHGEGELRAGLAAVAVILRRTAAAFAVGATVSLAGVCLGAAPLAALGGVLAVGACWLGARAFGRQRRELLAAHRIGMAERQRDLVAAVGGVLSEGAAEFFEQLETVWAPLEAFCETRAQRCRPDHKRIGNLEHSFHKLAQRLSDGGER